MTHPGQGQVLPIGVPDKNTKHIAKMVGNQRDNWEGFNRRQDRCWPGLGLRSYMNEEEEDAKNL